MIKILYHGKRKGKIAPLKKRHNQISEEHPYFGMTASTQKSVAEEMKTLRKGRVLTEQETKEKTYDHQISYQNG